MTAPWLNAQTERLVAAYLADARPAWLWTAEGEKLVWRNCAALAYETTHRRQSGDRFVPVPRQIPRIIRLGVPMRASRARLQFALGRKPISATCDCTPLILSGDVSALLAVMNEPVSESEFASVACDLDSVTPFTGTASHFVLTGSDGRVLVSGGDGAERLAADQNPASEIKTGAEASRLILFADAEPDTAPAEMTVATEDLGEPEEQPLSAEFSEGMETPVDATQEQDADASAEPDRTETAQEIVAIEQAETESSEAKPEDGEGLVELFDRLADRKVLYEPLDERDDVSFTASQRSDPETAEPDSDTMPVETGSPASSVEAGLPTPWAEAGLLAPWEEPEIPVPADTSVAVDPAEEADIPIPADELNAFISSTSEAPVPAGNEAEPAQDADQDADEDTAPVRLWRVIGHGLLQRSDHSEKTGKAAEAPDETEAWREPVFVSEEQVETAIVAETKAEDEPGEIEEETEVVEIDESELAPSETVDSEIAEPETTETEETGIEDMEAETAETDSIGADADETDAAEPDTEETETIAPEAPEETGTIEQTSRYNFDELSRILTDRVSADGEDRRDWPKEQATQGAGALINLGDETLILNRLPIGLMVFRDQQILFSNRALADLLGYTDSASLRKIGLSGVFPSDGDQGAGPVTKLIGADGRMLHVSARLQSISWQGRPALLLSASRQKEPLNAEDLARGFAEITATAIEAGYFETSRAGVLTSVSGRAATLAGRSPDSLIGRPIHTLVALDQGTQLRGFLDQPARFAGAERPMMRFTGAEPETEIILFAEGMAGIVTGYFGLLRKADSEAKPDQPDQTINPNFLIRLGRAVRQPITAIIGFAEMIRTESFGPVGNDRYIDYAKFIRSAGRDVASVIDELEHYANLSDGSYPADNCRIDLTELLELCVARVRPYAGTMRVLVRSGISSSLPEIVADRESLMQAVLNILSSAIAHSPNGGQVILSTQKRSDGGVEVHVRDSGRDDGSDPDDRFMVFRDGQSADGEILTPIQSTIGLALTQSLLGINACSLEIDPGPGAGTFLNLLIPAELAVGVDSVQR